MASDDDGATWSKPRDLNPMVKDPTWSAMWCSPGRGLQTRDGRLLVPSSSLRNGVSHSQMFASNDHGKTWKTLTASGPNTNEHMVVELADGRLMANMRSRHGKACRAVATSSDGGQTWQRQMPKDFERATFEEEFENPRPSLFCVQAIDASTAFICGVEATIMRTTDGGQTWDYMQTESVYALYTLKIANGKGWAVGDKGAYLVSDDNGETWQSKEGLIKSKQWFRDVSFSSPEKGWVVGQSGVVASTNDGGASWQFHSGLSYDMEFFEMPKALEFRDMPTWGPFARQ